MSLGYSMDLTRRVILLLAAATALVPAIGSQANTLAPIDPVGEDGFAFSVIGDVGSNVDGAVSDDALAEVGVEIVDAADASVATVVPRPLQAAATARSTNAIHHRWRDFQNREVVLREQPKKKISQKHNLTYRTPRAVTRYATIRTHAGGQAFRYRVIVSEVKCDFFGNNCTVTRRVWVRAIVDFWQYQGEKYGVVTAYCEGIDGKCPDFVKNALNQ